jgi:hypothetical protein
MTYKPLQPGDVLNYGRIGMDPEKFPVFVVSVLEVRARNASYTRILALLENECREFYAWDVHYEIVSRCASKEHTRR